MYRFFTSICLFSNFFSVHFCFSILSKCVWSHCLVLLCCFWVEINYHWKLMLILTLIYLTSICRRKKRRTFDCIVSFQRQHTVLENKFYNFDKPNTNTSFSANSVRLPIEILRFFFFVTNFDFTFSPLLSSPNFDFDSFSL